MIGSFNYKLIFRLVISAVFVAFLALKVNWISLREAFSEIDIFLYLFSTLLTLITSVLAAWKYHLLIRDTAIDLSILSLSRINLISRFYALFFPTAIGREAVRWYKVTRNREGRLLFLAATLFERTHFILVLLLCGMIPLFFHGSHPEIVELKNRLLPLAAVVFACILGLMLVFIFPGMRIFLVNAAQRFLEKHLERYDWVQKIQQISIRNYSISAYISMLMLSVIWQLVFVNRMYFLFKAIALSVGFFDVVWMSSLVLLLQILPISFAGIGVREGVYAYLFTLFKLPPEQGVLVGLLFFSQMLILATIGGLFELSESKAG